MPFSLTSAQKQAIADIHDDLSKERPMNRLVQGDVGSGRRSSLRCMRTQPARGRRPSRYETSILAQQHWGTLNELLAPLNLSVALLTGQTKVAERRKLLESLANGDQALLVGTHAVLEQDISFKIGSDRYRRQRLSVYASAEDFKRDGVHLTHSLCLLHRFRVPWR